MRRPVASEFTPVFHRLAHEVVQDSVSLCSTLKIGAPGWHSRLSVRLQPGHDLAVREFEPRVRLWADGSEPGACFRFCVSLSLSDPPLFMLCLSLSQKLGRLGGTVG